MRPKQGKDGGLHEMPSGLYHTADSLANGPHGMFVDEFGPPGDPTIKTHPGGGDSGAALGSAPRLLTKMQSSRQRSNSKS